MKDQRATYLVVGLLAAGGALLLMWRRLGVPPPDAAPATSASPVASDATASNAGSPSAAAAAAGSAAADSDGVCPSGMLYVSGMFCPFIAHRCDAYLGTVPEADGMAERHDEPRRCQRYRDDLICEGRPSQLRFCVDRFEYPNIEGVKPAVMVSYREAKQACKVEDKRLCEAEEWMLACEGPRTWPYPYGIERDPGACNVDRRLRRPNRRALSVPHDVSMEIERLDQRVPSGGLPRCKSPYGVADTTGNASEWIHNRDGDPHEAPRVSALAGGHWGRVPATCRRLDASHGASHRSHRTGFRCCRDALDGRKARRLAPSGTKLPRRRRLLE